MFKKGSYLLQYITKNSSRKKQNANPTEEQVINSNASNISNNSNIKASEECKQEDKLEKLSDKILQPPQKGRHRRTKSTITDSMVPSTQIIIKQSEIITQKTYSSKFKPNSSKECNINREAKTKHNERRPKALNFAPILEENYDNVIVKENDTEDDGSESGPSYLSALKFASVYNFVVSQGEDEISKEDLLQEKLDKINAYRERLKEKSIVVSRNIKKENESMQKRVSSKTESGIGGSSTQESLK